MQIPIAKPYLQKEEAAAAYNCILSGWVTQGPQVKQFEESFADYVGSEFAIAVSNCTTSLHLALIVAGIKSGDEVICPSMSFIATANSIAYTGATPIFAEVGNDYNLDVEKVEQLITKRTRAIILVHQMGMPADIEAFKRICKQHNLFLIEDAACAIGSAYKKQKIGSHSDLVCFSFHPRKVITTGEGGMITTSNEKFAIRLRSLRQHAMSINDRERHLAQKIIFEKYLELGYNYRMTDFQAAVGIKQLERIVWIIEQRRKIAEKYHEAFCKFNFLGLPLEHSWQFSNYQSYSIFIKKNCPISRNTIMEKLLKLGITTRRGIMVSHREPAYRNLNLKLPVSEKLSDNSFLIPLFVPLNDKEIKYIIKSLTGLFKEYQ